MQKKTPGLVAIFGSGELSDTMAEAHRNLMARINGPVIPVFLDTPAGFELNIDQIDEKAITYFKRNFGLDLSIARYRTAHDSPESLGAALTAIGHANYIFAGPGSPSYAVRMWQDSNVWEAVINRWRDGAILAFSSGAAVTLGQLAIPVYEIYKCGQDVHWLDGLDLLGAIDVHAAVIPHWNNNSGNQYDTRFCFMGAPRLAQLEAMLPPDLMVIGVDEYSGVCIDSQVGNASVFGPGEVIIRRAGHQATYTKGQQFSLVNAVSDQAALVSIEAAPEIVSEETDAGNEDVQRLKDSVQTALADGDLNRAVDGLLSLVLIANAGLEQGIYNRAELAVQALQTLIPPLGNLSVSTDAQSAFDQERNTLLDLIVTAREELRKAKVWSVADQLRDRLIELGYTISDTAEGTSVQRA